MLCLLSSKNLIHLLKKNKHMNLREISKAIDTIRDTLHAVLLYYTKLSRIVNETQPKQLYANSM